MKTSRKRSPSRGVMNIRYFYWENLDAFWLGKYLTANRERFVCVCVCIIKGLETGVAVRGCLQYSPALRHLYCHLFSFFTVERWLLTSSLHHIWIQESRRGKAEGPRGDQSASLLRSFFQRLTQCHLLTDPWWQLGHKATHRYSEQEKVFQLSISKIEKGAVNGFWVGSTQCLP